MYIYIYTYAHVNPVNRKFVSFRMTNGDFPISYVNVYQRVNPIKHPIEIPKLSRLQARLPDNESDAWVRAGCCQAGPL